LVLRATRFVAFYVRQEFEEKILAQARALDSNVVELEIVAVPREGDDGLAVMQEMQGR
jgi:hypothetical protein